MNKTWLKSTDLTTLSMSSWPWLRSRRFQETP